MAMEDGTINIEDMEDGTINIEETDSESDSEVNEVQWKPCLEMEFDSVDAAYYFYNNYGGRAGFSIRKEYANKSRKNGKITCRLFVCNKEGLRGKDKRDEKIKKLRVETHTNCGAHMLVRYDVGLQKFVVKQFEESHNHPLIMQQCTHMMPSQLKISSVQGREAIGYTKVDVQNYIRTRRQNELECGVAGWLMNYFQTQSWEDPSFFHVVQLDKDTMITNIFWADSKMISDYGHFGDVVTFDTTYKLIQGNRPLGVFLGLNHHRQTCVLGATFMYDEMADSFAWLFNTFLNGMSCKVPRTVLTDKDVAMAKALAEVMPDTNHHLCTWHLMLNAQKHIGNMSVGGKDFFKHFDTLLYDKRYKVYEAEYDLVQKMPRMKARFPILDHAGHVYTANIFDLFQEQLLIACMSQYILNCNDNGNGEYMYEVALYNQKVIRQVIRTRNNHLSCFYGKFKMEGVMCSYTLQVLRDKMCASKIPSRYVLKRWTRNAKDGRLEELIGTDMLTDPRLEMR
ncbi:protein FAR1-RELATED SEQUENCE 5-like [Cornus florida]|uniref:protein FAR1-RELATED SEQUENCE 5-like n=1 Tax=Cornus florida TaxID=4283 RepID=UPI00289E0844|nr:protein FAR1-RELATED SEQUENCE 5-like [Cornus florida]